MPGTTVAYLERFVVALAPGTALEVQPLIAYDDPVLTTERPALTELVAGIARRRPGVSLAPETRLAVGDLDRCAAVLRRADLTVCCSYHVALTSLMLEVPAVLVRDNLYYAQKADGLRRDFSLPAEMFPRLDDDPEGAAEKVASVVGLETGAETAFALGVARERVVRRRAGIEADLGAALSKLGESRRTTGGARRWCRSPITRRCPPPRVVPTPRQKRSPLARHGRSRGSRTSRRLTRGV